MNVVRIEGQRLGLHRVRDLAVQHPDAADLSIVSNADNTERVVRRGRHLTSTPGPVSVGVTEVVPRVRVAVVVVHISGGERVVVPQEIRVVLLNPVIENGDSDAEARHAEVPGALHHHVVVVSPVEIPHVVPVGIIGLRPGLENIISLNLTLQYKGRNQEFTFLGRRLSTSLLSNL